MDEIIYNNQIISKYIKITNEIYNPEYPNDYEEVDI
jgi:hypothetical protein